MDAAYPQIAERLFGRAHAIEPVAFRAIIDGPVARRVIAGEHARSERAPGVAQMRRKRLAAFSDAETISTGDGIEYAITGDGIAIVPVMGILSQRFDWLAALCGWTTYEGLSATLDAIGDDYRVRAVLLDIESPGGEAAGMLDIADKIIASRDQKPIWAVANVYAFSAAYAIAGAAETLFVPRLGQVGSVGAVCIHADESAYDAKLGVKYTAVYSGARKIDGWSHAPLSEPAASAMQHGVDYCRDQFAALVGRQGRMSAADAIKTEAALFHDSEAVDIGLADAVGSFSEALMQLSERVTSRRPGTAAHAASNRREAAMADPKAPDVKPEPKPEEKPAAAQPAAAAAKLPEAPAAEKPTPAQAAREKADTCPDCGREIVPAGEDSKAYGMAAVLETLDLCALAGASVVQAREFIGAKAPIGDVREKLTAAKAKKSNEAEIVTTAAKPVENAGWDDVVSKVNAQFGVGPKK